jgi:large subunit ribosomal protein L29
MNNQDLQLLIKDYFKLKMQNSAGQLKQNHLLKKMRRDIARHKTSIRQAELSASGGSK